MSGSVAGLLTSVPPLCFAVFGVTAPRLARRFGPGAVVCAGMVAITAGLLIRPYAGGTAGFLAATALALMGIAVSNVLMPVIVKRFFPRPGRPYDRPVLDGPRLRHLDRRRGDRARDERAGRTRQPGLAVWAALAAAAVLPWIPFVRPRKAPSTLSPAQDAPAGRRGRRRARDRACRSADGAVRRTAPAADHPQPYGLGARRLLRPPGHRRLHHDGLDGRRSSGTRACPPAHGAAARRHHDDGRAARLRHPARGHPPAPPGPDRAGYWACAGSPVTPACTPPGRRRLGLGPAARHLQLRLPARADHGRDAGQDGRGRRPAVRLRAEHRLPDLHPGPAAGGRALPAQRGRGCRSR